eukprot:TRINITY_DN9416_c0_g1_i1.p1 TRINITY_DN9416_c0_g1~~TRINITY_DN9416_c0_g1_i1.p1  ORF type:complete len:556 (+),score=162.62 TRINITY_DN9416_c0_g1_i1:146-1813(+)
MQRSSPYPMVSMEAALAQVLEYATHLPLVRRSIAHPSILGSTLGHAVHAGAPFPPFKASIMDGYAMKASDGRGEYHVSGSATAGTDPSWIVESGTVSYVTTGAMIPAGADCVVKIEDTQEAGEGRISVNQVPKPGQWVRQAGCDIAHHEEVLPAGHVLTAADIGLLATVGITEVSVHRVPRVAVVSTGNELVDPLTPGELPAGKIRDSNRLMLLAAVRELRADPVDMGIVCDSEEALKEAVLLAATQADIIVSTGGVSMGSLDLMKPLLESLGQVHFGRLHMKPGKPTTFGVVHTQGGGCPLFALPGNPCSAMSTFQLLVCPLIKAMQAQPGVAGVPAKCRTLHPLKMDAERPEFVRARVWYDPDSHELVAQSTGVQQSSRLLSFRGSNALLHVPQGSGSIPESSLHLTLTSQLQLKDTPAKAIRAVVLASEAAMQQAAALADVLPSMGLVGVCEALEANREEHLQRVAAEAGLVLVVDDSGAGPFWLEGATLRRASGIEMVMSNSTEMSSSTALWGPVAGLCGDAMVLSVLPEHGGRMIEACLDLVKHAIASRR